MAGGPSTGTCSMMGFADSDGGFSSMVVMNSGGAGAGSYVMETNNMSDHGNNINHSMRAKIMAHPYFPRLLAAYANCQKIGAPPEVVARLDEACASGVARSVVGGCIGEDPALDQFMEAYCEMLTKYEQELTKPFKEAMLFLSRIECQLNALTVASSSSGDMLFSHIVFSFPFLRAGVFVLLEPFDL